MTLWSDGCSYQNRCSVLSCDPPNHYISQVLRGGPHPHGVRCVHSTIETKLKQVTVNLPSDYINIIQGARKKGEKYRVKYIDYTFFKDFKAVCDIVNLDYSDSDWKELCKHDVLLFQPAPALYEGPLLISYAKWKDLQDKEDNPRRLSFIL